MPEHAMMCVAAAFPDVSTLSESNNALDHGDCEYLQHHGESLERTVIALLPKSLDGKLARASFSYRYGLYCFTYGLASSCQSWDRVEALLRSSAEIYTEILGEKHPRTLKSRHQLILVQIENQKDVAARTDLDKILILIMLNTTHHHYESWVVAAREFFLALKELSRLHGHDSVHVLRILQRLVVFYRLWVQSGDIDATRPVWEAFQAIDRFGIISDSQSFKVARGIPAIEAVREFGRSVYYAEANGVTITQAPPREHHTVLDEWERLAQNVFDQYKMHSGERHPDTLRSLSELATAKGCQGGQGQVENALRLAETVYRLHFKVLGESHRDTLETKRICGELLLKAGRPIEAVKLLKECYDTLLVSWKETSKRTLECAYSLAEAYHAVGRFGRSQEADDLMEQMIKVREAEFKAKNDWKPQSLCYALELTAVLQRKEGQFSKAVETYKRIFALNKYADPSYCDGVEMMHECKVKIRHSIAVCYFQGGNWEEAEKWGLEVLEQRRKGEVERTFYGVNHVNTLWSLFLVALARWNLGRREEAKGMLEECWNGAEARLGIEHELSKQVLEWWKYAQRSMEQDEKDGQRSKQDTPEPEQEGEMPPPPYVEFPCRRRAYRRS
ncbi:hypothetical protein B0T21DRAFT_384202 [Apiosordaria backusii]|uniref:Uncharacterized protein n=1 Tax=Apiosordaria backusii TaxID=314023 RepID=A0AA40BJF3_9PEZI|nr:hypothetical protein B0T21DRAFT_384202 [Apiosordaria backusii]